MDRNWKILHLINLIEFAKTHRWTKQMLVEIKRTQVALLSAPAATAADR